MRLLITGVAGMLGTDLAALLKDDHEVYGIDIKESINQISNIKYQILDITNVKETYETITKINPELIIHTAAYTDVDGAEKNSDLAFQINALGTRNVALACQRFDAALMYISTDYVFDGQKDKPYIELDKPNPLGIYAQSKYWGELYTQWLLNRFYIIRSSWLFGKNGKNFVDAFYSQIKSNHPLKVVTDQIGSPTYTKDLSLAIKQLLTTNSELSTGLYGIWHITNSGVCSWYDFAKFILQITNNKLQIEPITSEELNRPAKRPKNSILNNYNWKLHGFVPLRSWREALKNYLTLKK